MSRLLRSKQFKMLVTTVGVMTLAFLSFVRANPLILPKAGQLAGKTVKKFYGSLEVLDLTLGTGPGDMTGGRRIILSPDGTSAYMLNQKSGQNSYTFSLDNTISMYSRNTVTGGLTQLTPFTVSVTTPEAMVFSSDSNSAYVAGSNKLIMFSRNKTTGALTVLGTSTLPGGVIDVAISPDDKFVYALLSNGTSSAIYMYNRNTTTGALTALSPSNISASSTNSDSPKYLAISPDGTSLYVGNQGNGGASTASISMFSRNTTTGALTALNPLKVTSGSYLYDVIVSPDNKWVLNGNNNDGNISIFSRDVNTGALTFSANFSLGIGAGQYQMAMSSDSQFLYIVAGSDVVQLAFYSSTGTITALSPKTKATVYSNSGSSIVLSPDTNGVFLYALKMNGSPAGLSYLYTFTRNSTTGLLTMVNPTSTGTQTGPNAIGISRDSKSVYVSNYTSNSISIFNLDSVSRKISGASPSTATVGTNPSGVVVSWDGTSVYVTNKGSNTVSMFSRDTGTGALTALSPSTVGTGTSPTDIAITPDGTSVYVVNQGSNTISMYSRDPSTSVLTALSSPTIATGTGPQSIVVSGDGNNVYVTNTTAKTISMYSRHQTTGALTALNGGVGVGTGSNAPWGIAITPDGKSVFAAGGYYFLSYDRNVATGLLTSVYSMSSSSNDVRGIAISPDGLIIYGAANGGKALVAVLRNPSAAALSVFDPWPVGNAPSAVAITSDNLNVIVTNFNDNTISNFYRK